jgi:hypothetical protein
MITFQMTELGCTDDKGGGLRRGTLHFGFGSPSERPHTRGQCMISLFQFPSGSNLPVFCAEAMLLPRAYLAK